MTKKEKIAEARRIKEEIESHKPKAIKPNGITEKQKEDNNKRRKKNSSHKNVPHELYQATNKKTLGL